MTLEDAKKMVRDAGYVLVRRSRIETAQAEIAVSPQAVELRTAPVDLVQRITTDLGKHIGLALQPYMRIERTEDYPQGVIRYRGSVVVLTGMPYASAPPSVRELLLAREARLNKGDDES